MPSVTKKPSTLYEKVLESHIVDERDDGTLLLYIGKFLHVWGKKLAQLPSQE